MSSSQCGEDGWPIAFLSSGVSSTLTEVWTQKPSRHRVSQRVSSNFLSDRKRELPAGLLFREEVAQAPLLSNEVGLQKSRILTKLLLPENPRLLRDGKRADAGAKNPRWRPARVPVRDWREGF
jgi:hypothetical protein